MVGDSCVSSAAAGDVAAGAGTCEIPGVATGALAGGTASVAGNSGSGGSTGSVGTGPLTTERGGMGTLGSCSTT